MRFSVVNLGCKVNAYETEGVARQLEQKGYERFPFSEGAEITVIFTCAVTNTAAAKSRRMIHRARRKHPDGIVAVAGCYAQIDADALLEADILIGTREKNKLADYIEAFTSDHQRIRAVKELEGAVFEPLPVDRFEGKTRAFLKIQDGCNQFCAYCVIPYARGRERSMEPDAVIAEAKRISANHKEIVLAGIHTGRYGREYGVTLADLLERLLAEVPELSRIRISSIEVTELDDHFLNLLYEEPRIARHLHIPVQSGSDGVLRRMGRPYTKAEFLSKINEIRSKLPDISISTDLMVGFPGETEAEFEETLAFMKECRFSFLHVFPYSVRSGTKAAVMHDQIDAETKKKRARICIDLSERLYDAYKDSMIGKPVDVLCESNGTGHTSEYLEVELEEPCEAGELVPAVISRREGNKLFGKKERQV